MMLMDFLAFLFFSSRGLFLQRLSFGFVGLVSLVMIIIEIWCWRMDWRLFKVKDDWAFCAETFLSIQQKYYNFHHKHYHQLNPSLSLMSQMTIMKCKTSWFLKLTHKYFWFVEQIFFSFILHQLVSFMSWFSAKTKVSQKRKINFPITKA